MGRIGNGGDEREGTGEGGMGGMGWSGRAGRSTWAPPETSSGSAPALIVQNGA